MKLEESCHQNADDDVHYERHHDENVVAELVIVLGYKFVVKAPDYSLIEVVGHEDSRYITDNQYVYQEQQEVLPIPEAYAVVNPRTMVVHVKHAPVACRAVMASLGLENIAHEAVSTTLVLIVAQVKAPENWHLSRISRHGLKERP